VIRADSRALEKVARIILYQHKNYDGSGCRTTTSRETACARGSVLRASMAHDELTAQGMSDTESWCTSREQGARRSAAYAALDQLARNATSAAERRVLPNELEVGMILQED